MPAAAVGEDSLFLGHVPNLPSRLPALADFPAIRADHPRMHSLLPVFKRGNRPAGGGQLVLPTTFRARSSRMISSSSLRSSQHFSTASLSVAAFFS